MWCNSDSEHILPPISSAVKSGCGASPRHRLASPKAVASYAKLLLRFLIERKAAGDPILDYTWPIITRPPSTSKVERCARRLLDHLAIASETLRPASMAQLQRGPASLSPRFTARAASAATGSSYLGPAPATRPPLDPLTASSPGGTTRPPVGAAVRESTALSPSPTICHAHQTMVSCPLRHSQSSSRDRAADWVALVPDIQDPGTIGHASGDNGRRRLEAAIR